MGFNPEYRSKLAGLYFPMKSTTTGDAVYQKCKLSPQFFVVEAQHLRIDLQFIPPLSVSLLDGLSFHQRGVGIHIHGLAIVDCNCESV